MVRYGILKGAGVTDRRDYLWGDVQFAMGSFIETARHFAMALRISTWG